MWRKFLVRRVAATHCAGSGYRFRAIAREPLLHRLEAQAKIRDGMAVAEGKGDSMPLRFTGDSMQAQVRKPALVLATGLLVAAAAFAMPKAHASCGEQRDFLVRQDPLLASVRPVDCATLMDGPPQFSWPVQAGRNTYTVALRFPDGHVERRTTTQNWLSWDHPVPPGEYSWHVSVAGPERNRSAARAFRIERNAPAVPAPQANGPSAAPAASPPAASGSGAPELFRVVPSESWVPSPKASRPARTASVGGFFQRFTE
jgi:hypothetical protein